MAFHVYHRYGTCDSNPPLGTLDTLYDELSVDDDEHPSVSVEHESAWSLGAYGGGLLVWENVEDGEPRYMHGVSRDEVLRLWRLLASGDIDEINTEPWMDGYG